MKRFLLIFFVCFFTLISFAFADEYNFIKAEELKKIIESGKRVHLIDVQKESDFERKHIKNSIKTDAYPVKSEEDKKKLESVIEKVKKDNLDIIIICQRGSVTGKNTYDYMKSRGIEERRLFILEGGITGFPYDNLCNIK